jgi:hypothetical protein
MLAQTTELSVKYVWTNPLTVYSLSVATWFVVLDVANGWLNAQYAGNLYHELCVFSDHDPPKIQFCYSVQGS